MTDVEAARLFRRQLGTLLEAEEERIASERSDARRALVGTGDRNARVRTYNFPQNRVTDHRLEDSDRKNFNLDGIIEGRLAPMLEALEDKDRRTRLANLLPATHPVAPFHDPLTHCDGLGHPGCPQP